MKRMLNQIPFLRFTPVILMIGVLVLSGCNPEEAPSAVSETPSPSSTVILPTLTPDLPPAATAPEILSTQNTIVRPSYIINASLENSRQALIVDQSILVPHPANFPLENIQLAVVANDWRDVFILQDLSSANIPVSNYYLEGVKLTIDFDDPGWQPGEVLELKLSYRLALPEQNARPGYGPSPFGSTVLQTNLVDWYPMVVPYQEGSGWLIHDPWIFGEFLVYPAADYEINLDLGGADLVAAASTIAEDRNGVLYYSLKSARNFVISLSPSYFVLADEVDGVEVFGYFFPGYEVPAKAAFNATVDALRLYSDLYGPYQQPSLSMVQADFNHGMEYQGLYFQSKGFFDTYGGSVESYLITIAVHETAHQWWYGQVANDQALEPWLDEALCTFSELTFYESLYPDSVDWWWAVRVDYYQPEGRIDRSIYQYQEYIDKQYLTYRNATYLQGAKFFSALKGELGDDLFYDFLREYALRYRDQIASREDFFDLLEEYLDLGDLEWVGEYFQ